MRARAQSLANVGLARGVANGQRLRFFWGVKQNQDGGFSLEMGRRVLKSIDFTNEYEGFYGNMKTHFFALTFSYTINQVFREFPGISRTLKGEAQVYLDQTDGQWKLFNMTLENEVNEYMAALRQKYGEAS